MYETQDARREEKSMQAISYADKQLTQAQDRDNSRTYLLTNETTGTVCEILPVTLESNQVIFLRRPLDSQAASWLVPHEPGMHPNDTVLQHMRARSIHQRPFWR